MSMVVAMIVVGLVLIGVGGYALGPVPFAVGMLMVVVGLFALPITWMIDSSGAYDDCPHSSPAYCD
jgi:hypothetical protein